ncbi:hypothetical protein [Chlorobium sp. KB01]|uniref:hypothetical protein n=1 Tax=Chlorobium sp. KB01 TaxID=1917528 RepID=UPI000975F368|nr:hypothetical protein [Chlorobium sp. KB01]
MGINISAGTLHQFLGIPAETPLSIEGMCRKIRPVIYPAPLLPVRLEQFCLALVSAMNSLEITVLSEEEASGSDGRFLPGTVVFAPGSFTDDMLAINRVSTLYNNIIVGIYDEPPPLTTEALPQERLDAIVGRLARDMVHILIFVTDRSWTICTMNGGVVTFNTPLPAVEDVRCTLVPKLTAQVVPPRPEDLDMKPGALQTDTPLFRTVGKDFAECSRLWRDNHCLLTHTSTAGLAYRSDFYKRIVARYLDQRSGMSYGFFARQLPVAVQPAILCSDETGSEEREMEHEGTVRIVAAGKTFLVPVPEVSVITTRSGCRKHHLDPQHDLVEIGISGGRAWLKTPAGVSPSGGAKPSFDTLTILAHALGNAITASILMRLRPDELFPAHLGRYGASMTHWHDYPDMEMLPEGYYLHGAENPPVSCSTPQSAAYSLLGKIEALEQALEKGAEYRGDVHIEPNHGTNIVGLLTLAETAAILNPEAVAEIR